jgi:glycosyltransferase involved in cell wall biosynthesis
MLTIGIDIRILTQPLTGIGYYTLQMCHALSKIDQLSIIAYSPAPIPEKHMKYLAGIDIKVMNFKNRFLRQLWTVIFLPIQARQDNLDVFWGPAHAIPPFLPASVKSILTIHDLVWKFHGETMRTTSRLLESYRMPRAINSCHQIIADSHSTRNAVIQEFSFEQKRIHVIPLAPRLKTDSDLRKKIPENFSIKGEFSLFVGTHEPRKNLRRLLEAYAALPTRMKVKVSLVIVGNSGWGSVKVEEWVSQLNLKDYVIILGYIEDGELAALYKQARFLVLPSLYEGFGLPIIEAMSFGTPVLTSNKSSMPEVAGDGAILVNPLSVDAITNGLTDLIGDDVLCNKLAKASLINAQKYSWEKSASDLFQVFKNAISEK